MTLGEFKEATKHMPDSADLWFVADLSGWLDQEIKCYDTPAEAMVGICDNVEGFLFVADRTDKIEFVGYPNAFRVDAQGKPVPQIQVHISGWAI